MVKIVAVSIAECYAVWFTLVGPPACIGSFYKALKFRFLLLKSENFTKPVPALQSRVCVDEIGACSQTLVSWHLGHPAQGYNRSFHYPSPKTFFGINFETRHLKSLVHLLLD